MNYDGLKTLWWKERCFLFSINRHCFERADLNFLPAGKRIAGLSEKTSQNRPVAPVEPFLCRFCARFHQPQNQRILLEQEWLHDVEWAIWIESVEELAMVRILSWKRFIIKNQHPQEELDSKCRPQFFLQMLILNHGKKDEFFIHLLESHLLKNSSTYMYQNLNTFRPKACKIWTLPCK